MTSSAYETFDPCSDKQLERLLSEPTSGVVDTMRRLEGDVVLLGAAGKMGLSLATMVRRASDGAGICRRVIAVSRFSSQGEDAFHAHGIETVRCDLLARDAASRLPDAPNVIAMFGMKFGSAGNTALTWAMNSFLPGVVCRRYPSSRIVAFSTGNVYPLVPVAGGGSRETDPLEPVGEYGMSCVGRERVYEYFSRSESIPMALIRLNYACDLRYGVLVDLAEQVWSGKPVDVTMGYFNTIWQGDANAMTLRAFDHLAVPPRVWNVTGREVLRVRDVCLELGRQMDRPVAFAGVEAPTALLSNASASLERLGPPRVDAERLVGWVAERVRRGGRRLGKPTHFEARDGRF